MTGAPAVATPALAPALPPKRRPRLGYLGVGWIGRHRLAAMAAEDVADVVAIADASADAATEALAIAPAARRVPSLDALLALELDGVVIATPSALHAEQAQRALEAGVAVFCQKPLARTAAQTRELLAAARAADRLLGVDLSYRHLRAAGAVRDLVARGELGDVFALDLVFHNAYGPDKAWFRDPALSGGGCVIDLGVHLVDLALWMLGWPTTRVESSRLFAGGTLLGPDPSVVEDYAVAQLGFGDGGTIRLACSWNLSTGCDAEISATVRGTRGGAAVRNVGGSFYDFVAERYDGTQRTTLVEPPDDWGGRAAVAWLKQLADSPRYDDAIEHAADVAAILDGIYGR